MVIFSTFSLDQAIRTMNMEAVKHLLSVEAVLKSESEGIPPLHIAIETKNLPLMNLVLNFYKKHKYNKNLT